MFSSSGRRYTIMKVVVIVLLVVVVVVLSLVVSSCGVSYTVVKTAEHNPSLPHFVLDGVVLHGETFGNPENPLLLSCTVDPVGTTAACCRSKR